MKNFFKISLVFALSLIFSSGCNNLTENPLKKEDRSLTEQMNLVSLNVSNNSTILTDLVGHSAITLQQVRFKVKNQKDSVLLHVFVVPEYSATVTQIIGQAQSFSKSLVRSILQDSSIISPSMIGIYTGNLNLEIDKIDCIAPDNAMELFDNQNDYQVFALTQNNPNSLFVNVSSIKSLSEARISGTAQCFDPISFAVGQAGETLDDSPDKDVFPDSGFGNAFPLSTTGINNRIAYSYFKWNGNGGSPYTLSCRTYEHSIVLNDYNNNSGTFLTKSASTWGFPTNGVFGSNLPDPYLDTRFLNSIGNGSIQILAGSPHEIDYTIGTYTATNIQKGTDYYVAFQMEPGSTNTDIAKITGQTGRRFAMVKNPFFVFGSESEKLTPGVWPWSLPGFLFF